MELADRLERGLARLEEHGPRAPAIGGSPASISKRNVQLRVLTAGRNDRSAEAVIFHDGTDLAWPRRRHTRVAYPGGRHVDRCLLTTATADYGVSLSVDDDATCFTVGLI